MLYFLSGAVFSCYLSEIRWQTWLLNIISLFWETLGFFCNMVACHYLPALQSAVLSVWQHFPESLPIHIRIHPNDSFCNHIINKYSHTCPCHNITSTMFDMWCASDDELFLSSVIFFSFLHSNEICQKS